MYFSFVNISINITIVIKSIMCDEICTCIFNDFITHNKKDCILNNLSSYINIDTNKSLINNTYYDRTKSSNERIYIKTKRRFELNR